MVKYLAENENTGIDTGHMLYYALFHDALDFADTLIENGVNLNSHDMNIMTTLSGDNRDDKVYIDDMTSLQDNQVLPVLKRLSALAALAGKKLTMNQTLFEGMRWSDTSLVFAMENIDMSRVTRKNILETSVLENYMKSLNKMTDAGWLANKVTRENLIKFARDNKCNDMLAWIMDFKNRTVDIEAEAAKEAAKIIRKHTEKP